MHLKATQHIMHHSHSPISRSSLVPLWFQMIQLSAHAWYTVRLREDALEPERCLHSNVGKL